MFELDEIHSLFTYIWFNKAMKPNEWMQNKQEVLQQHKLCQLIRETGQWEQQMLRELNENEIYDYMVSKMNYCQRKQMISCSEMGVHIRIGDICYIDFGMSYLWETGYQHFGLILSMQNKKAFIVPISGNYQAYLKAWSKDHIEGKSHIMRLGCLPGMNKTSVLYINDAKWINTARIIDVKAHVNIHSQLFKDIKQRTIEMI